MESVGWGGSPRQAVCAELLDFTSTEDATMSEDRPPLNALLQKAGEGGFLRAVAESVQQLLMEAHVESLIGAVIDRTPRQMRRAARQTSSPACAQAPTSCKNVRPDA